MASGTGEIGVPTVLARAAYSLEASVAVIDT
jgi:hypothetical protein